MMPQTAEITPTVLRLADLHPRLRNMILELWRHQNIILTYETGQILLNYHGDKIKPEIGKLALNSCNNP